MGRTLREGSIIGSPHPMHPYRVILAFLSQSLYNFTQRLRLNYHIDLYKLINIYNLTY
jgi:hypothetical protein